MRLKISGEVATPPLQIKSSKSSYPLTNTKMKKVAQVATAAIAIIAVVFVGYGLYQQSQLYPLMHQEIGYQKAAIEVNQLYTCTPKTNPEQNANIE